MITKSLEYTDITVKMIESIKDVDTYTNLAIRWKNIAIDKHADIEFVLVKLAFYHHYLYENARLELRLWEMCNTY